MSQAGLKRSPRLSRCCRLAEGAVGLSQIVEFCRDSRRTSTWSIRKDAPVYVRSKDDDRELIRGQT